MTDQWTLRGRYSAAAHKHESVGANVPGSATYVDRAAAYTRTSEIALQSLSRVAGRISATEMSPFAVKARAGTPLRVWSSRDIKKSRMAQESSCEETTNNEAERSGVGTAEQRRRAFGPGGTLQGAAFRTPHSKYSDLDNHTLEWPPKRSNT